MKNTEMPADYALVLRQVEQLGAEDFTALAETLDFEKARLLHIVWSLKNKGLLKVSYGAQATWISLSSKGKRLITRLWPKPTGYGY
jgi:hypothetical protein